ncbi:hypothetical protein PV04_10727 [Phialophora macrospora]|uniref:Uncharacterized protein n=1 Tax=Phialophora macrospora TaxID=1851006 RepID=A0A0D2F6K2_9EURO|nr:hypothetical protein PV04_10727 [Phialophora macrospora]
MEDCARDRFDTSAPRRTIQHNIRRAPPRPKGGIDRSQSFGRVEGSDLICGRTVRPKHQSVATTRHATRLARQSRLSSIIEQHLRIRVDFAISLRGLRSTYQSTTI